MIKYFLLLFSCALLNNMNAQDAYPLHPSVGDTISVDEKLDYSLFPEIENKGFQYALIVYEKDSFYLCYSIKNIDEEIGLELESFIKEKTPLTQEQIIEEQKKIEKINAYYRLMAEEKKKEKEKPELFTKDKKSYPVRLEGAMSEKMKKDARMQIRLQEDARRQQEFEMGLRPREMRIEFK